MSLGISSLEGCKPVGLCEDVPVHPGKQVKRWRAERDLSLDDLAELAGTDKMNLSKIERGIVDPRAGTLQKIAEALGLSLAALLTGPGLSTPSGTTEPSKEGADAAQVRQRMRLEGLETALLQILETVRRGLAEYAEDGDSKRKSG